MSKPVTAEYLAELREKETNPAIVAHVEKKLRFIMGAGPVRRQIEQAFAGVKLGQGVGLQQAQGLDDREDDATLARYRQGDEKGDWSRIPAEELDRCNSSPSFFDAEGMRFHLPAFLTTELRGEYGHSFIFHLTYHLPGDCEHQFALLSAAQRAAVRAFLMYSLDDPDVYDQEEIRRVLDAYWIEPNDERER